MGLRFTLTQDAARDLEIMRAVLQKENPMAAERVRRAIQGAFSLLQDFRFSRVKAL